MLVEVFNFKADMLEKNLKQDTGVACVKNMGDASTKINVEELLSYCDDLVSVLRDKRDINRLTRSLEQYAAVNSSSVSDFEDVQNSVQDYQRKIDDCWQKTEDAKSEVVADDELDNLQKELNEELQKENLLKADLRVIELKIDELDQQRLSIEERRQTLKKLESDVAKAQSKLSFYASVTNIIPNLGRQSEISGRYVRKDKQEALEFKFNAVTEDSFEICNSIWEMISP